MPPRRPDSAPKFWECVDNLTKLHPDFLSVTFGAAGNDRSTALNVNEIIVRDTPILPIAHLTCVDTPSEQVAQIVDDFLAVGVRTFLALRGDPPIEKAEFHRDLKQIESAAELTYLIRQIDKRRQRQNIAEKFKSIARPLVICVAAFPNGNPELGTNQDQEIDRLLEKQDSGADFAITQLYYDSKVFDQFMSKCLKRGVSIPIIAGILPSWNVERLQRVKNSIKIAPSSGLVNRLNSAWSAEERERIGLDFWSAVSREAISSGAVGVHLFSFNQAESAILLANRLQDAIT
jgi:methylenetetrahydrofolate reductase (NADPH)